jgi:hypothetical protein
MRTPSFSVIILATVAPGKHAPAQVAISRQGTTVALTWPSSSGQFFSVDQRSSLSDGQWLPLAPNLAATTPGTNTTFTHLAALQASNTFYRVRPVPAPFTFSWSGTNFTYTVRTAPSRASC